MYLCIYLIKHPGVYFLATSVEGAFKQDGRLFETGVYCYVYFKLLHSSSYYAILGCCHSSRLKSLVVGVVFSFCVGIFLFGHHK